MPKKNAKAQKTNELDGAEFFAAINLIEKEKGIPKAYMLEKITQALVTAYKRDHEGAGDNVTVEADEEKGTVRMFVKKDVVEEVDNPCTEMSLEMARDKLPQAQLGLGQLIPGHLQAHLGAGVIHLLHHVLLDEHAHGALLLVGLHRHVVPRALVIPLVGGDQGLGDLLQHVGLGDALLLLNQVDGGEKLRPVQLVGLLRFGVLLRHNRSISSLVSRGRAPRAPVWQVVSGGRMISAPA